MTNVSIRLFILLNVILGTLLLYPPQVSYGQNEAQVECGDIVEGEFSQNAEEHIYLLAMKPKEAFEVAVEPAGEDLQTVIGIYGPSDLRVALTGEVVGGWYHLVSHTPKLASGILGSNGVYKIRLTNTAISTYSANKTITSDLLADAQFYGGVGAYAFSIRCTKSNGEIIEPGESSALSGSSSVTAEQSSAPISPQEPASQVSITFLEIGQTYEVFFGSQALTVKIVEVQADGWAKIEVKGKSGWLNIHQVALIMPTNN